MRVLFITGRFPMATGQGDQARAYHQLRLLGRNHRITLVSFVDGPVPDQSRQSIAQFCERVTLVRRSPLKDVAQIARNLFARYPLQTMLYQSQEMARTLSRLLAQDSFDLAHVQLVRMAPYLENEGFAPRVVDLIDALSLNMERRFHTDHTPLRLAAYLEWKRLQRYERVVCDRYDRALVVSPIDRAAIGRLDKVDVIPIGVDLSHFPAASTEREPFTLTFTGNMHYFPNVDAVRYFVREVLPLVRREVPSAHLRIMGARPSRAVRQLARREGVEVTGYVPNLAHHLARAAVAVCPMRSGSGMQFKVIEGMAARTPVVATHFALGGLDAAPGEHLLVADGAAQFAEQVIRLLKDSQLAAKLSENARRLVEERYTWEASVASLEQVYRQVVQEHSIHGGGLP